MSDEQDAIRANVNLHVEDTGGDGRAIVLIHGWPLSGKSWSEQVPAFQSAGYRVITYDRRGFGESDKLKTGYDYDTFADDLAQVIDSLELTAVTLVGFSMGGGEVARYVSRHGQDKLRSVVFASAVPPMMLKTDNNPDGPLEESAAKDMENAVKSDIDAFYDDFTRQFFSANADGNILVSKDQREAALELCRQADKTAVLGAMEAFGMTDFREDLPNVNVPALIIHGDADGIVPFEGSGKRTHEMIPGSEQRVISGGPHGVNVSHAEEFNEALLDFFKK